MPRASNPDPTVHEFCEHDLDQALARYLERREEQPDLLPSEFASQLDTELGMPFLDELDQLADIDRIALAPPRDLPRRFGDFRILAELGRGASGIVYEAEQVSLRRRVALKVQHPHLAHEPLLAERFRREAQTAAALEHAHIVSVHQVGAHDGVPYIAMRLLQGHSLHRLLRARDDARDTDHAVARRFFADPMKLARAFAGVAAALDYAHRRGVVHRDVKPSNLMVLEDGSVAILDFGIARSRELGSLTQTGDFLGTPLYMSPEQAGGEREIGPPSDVYALGAVLYECVTGQRCVEDGPLPAVLDQIRSRAVVPAECIATLPPRLADILARCLQKDRSHRYGSALELATDLQQFASLQQSAGLPQSAGLLRSASLQPFASLPRSASLQPFASGTAVVAPPHRRPPRDRSPSRGLSLRLSSLLLALAATLGWCLRGEGEPADRGTAIEHRLDRLTDELRHLRALVPLVTE